MNKEIRNIILIVVGALISLGVFYKVVTDAKNKPKLPYYDVDVSSTEFLEHEFPTPHKIKDFSFTNQDGKMVNLETVKGKVFVADYIFTTCPGICKAMSIEMENVYKAYKGDDRVRILSHTSKPHEDSVVVLNAYAKLRGVNDAQQWHFLTGDINELQRMALNEYGIINPDDIEGEGSFVHTELFVLVDQEQNIRGYYDGTDSADVNLLINDISILLDN